MKIENYLTEVDKKITLNLKAWKGRKNMNFNL